MPKRETVVEIAGRPVRISNPDKVYFPRSGHTKLAVVQYYAAVADAALRGIAGRPIVLKRYVDGVEGEAFYQKRAPANRPPWIDTVTLRFPSGRAAEEVVVSDAAQLLWIVNLGSIELHPHPVRAIDLDHPDELRVDLDPGPGVEWAQVVRVALTVREVLAEHGLVGWPKTSGSRGLHVNVRLEPRWGFVEVRRAALAIAREVERRLPGEATASWWKEERHGVFLDYNQNAKDRTVASAWSVRPTPDARVSMPLDWDEVPASDPAAFTILTAPGRLAAEGDRGAGIDGAAGSLDELLALSARQEAAGQGDAPWPPHYTKQAAEPRRVMPSKDRTKRGKRPATRPTASADADPAIPSSTGRRTSIHPLVTIARAAHRADAVAGLERWKARHPSIAARLEPADVLVDSMRGRSTTWTRVRVNLRHIPESERPPPAPPDPDYDPWAA